jgi:hypothetical protein
MKYFLLLFIPVCFSCSTPLPSVELPIVWQSTSYTFYWDRVGSEPLLSITKNGNEITISGSAQYLYSREYQPEICYVNDERLWPTSEISVQVPEGKLILKQNGLIALEQTAQPLPIVRLNAVKF